MTEPHVLLISPKFHGYWESITRALEGRGHQVTPHVYDDFSTVRAKIRNKALYELPDRIRAGSGTSRFRQTATDQALQVLETSRPDVILAIKCDVFDDRFWDAADRQNIPVVLWLYDELRRMHFTPEHLARFHAVVSYSPQDVAHLADLDIEAHHLPNAFDASFQVTPICSDDVVFVGARYPIREQLMVDMYRAGVPIRVYGRDWSHSLIDRARTWDWNRPDLPHGPQVSRSEGYGLIAGAAAALNIHENQDGFTMRTFEAPGVGALQLIDRDDVDVFYEPGEEVLVFHDVTEAAELAERARRDPTWRTGITRAGQSRTLAEHTFEHRVRTLAALWD